VENLFNDLIGRLVGALVRAAHSAFQALVTDCDERLVDRGSSDIFDYVEMFYDRTRRHSDLGGVSPEAFENASKHAL
jgi:hypothetical protein